eukprot:361994-Chlamydomonas_euryale.AAC.8
MSVGGLSWCMTMPACAARCRRWERWHQDRVNDISGLRQLNGSDGVSPLIPHLNDRLGVERKGRLKGRK